ncbi:uncharacterized protein CDAR_517871 [Caerostris darwini]|uniref:Gustatory receptor n=1 Tax=Caerostris darwini TaxID=1538125 RepID=A0AAV4PUV3_9ARAC|nr:uncharacterized protein CDAR_517871 [Caerostris darwini]
MKVFKHLDKLRSQLKSTNNFDRWKNKINANVVISGIYHVIYSFAYTYFVMHFKDSREDIATVYWLNMETEYSEVLYALNFMMLFLKRALTFGYCTYFVHFYLVTCFVIIKTCKMYRNEMGKEDACDMNILYGLLTRTTSKIDRRLNFLAFISFTLLFFHSTSHVFLLIFGDDFFFEFASLFHFIECFNSLSGFLVMIYAGAMVNDSGRALQEKAMSLDAELYLEQPEILLKYQRFKIAMTLWDVINLQKSLIVTIVEVVVSYVVLVGTT